MKIRVLSFLLPAISFAVIAVSSAAQVIDYDNGPINGTEYGWKISSGFVVSDSFFNTTLNVIGFSFGAWLSPGDVLQSAEVSITDEENGGATWFDQVVSFTQSDCVMNQSGFDVCLESSSFGVHLDLGTQYWLNLQNAVTSNGDPAYWDQNSGPSLASDTSIGTIPSESFTLYGQFQGTSTTSVTATAPEPGSALLLGSAVLALAAFVRRFLS